MISPAEARDSFFALVGYLVDVDSPEPVELGGVTFWSDTDGPFAHELAYDVPVHMWDIDAVTQALSCRLALIKHH